MPAIINKDRVLSEYSVDKALIRRLNPDQTVPCLKDYTFQNTDELGNVVTHNVTGGIQGFLTKTNISAIDDSTGVNLQFVVDGKKDLVNIDLSSIVDPLNATVEQVATALNTSIGQKSNFPNIGFPFKAEKDVNNRLRIKADVTDADATAYSPTFYFAVMDEIADPPAPAAATALGLAYSAVRPIDNPKSLTDAANVTDAEEISNTDGKGTVTTITTSQSVTGYEVTLEDAQRNPYNRQAIEGGYFNVETGVFTPRKSGTPPPSFALIAYSRIFKDGNSGEEGYVDVAATIYPSCTGVKDSNDKNEQEFNNDTYTITAADGIEIPAGQILFHSKDEYLAIKSFSDEMLK